MSIRLAIAAVTIALLLGVALALMQRGAGPGGNGSSTATGPAELAAFDAGRVIAMSLDQPDHPTVRIRRSPAGAWALHADGAADWPVVPDNPINLLRALRTLSGQPVADSPLAAGGVPPDAVTLTLESDLEERTVFAFDPAPVAGKIRAWAQGRGPYLIADEILIALTDPGPTGWRIPRAFPGLNEFTAARVLIESDEGGTELVRRGASWSMLRPVIADADPEAAAELVRTLASMPVSRFMPATDAVLRRAESEPALRIEVGSRRDASAVLRIWNALEPTGSILLASVSSPDAPDTFLAIPASGLTGVGVDPRRYLSRHPSQQPAASIAIIDLRALDTGHHVRLQRDLNRWTIAIDEGESRPDTTGLAGALLRALTGRPARVRAYPDGPASPAPDEATAAALPVPDGFTTRAILTLRGLDDGVLEVLRLGTSAEDDASVWTVLRGQARWDLEPDPALDEIDRLFSASMLPGLR